MTTHVFVVNDRTFKYHLEYMFAGTCASSDVLFLENSNYTNSRKKDEGITAKQELTAAGMIADISRIRAGDKILFYLTQQGNEHEGLFFGTFKAVGEPFYNTNSDNYLSEELGVCLNFRIQIEPDIVFSAGVSEHDALDSLENISHPSQMCWSMIYRKLKGKRGCTMLTEYESERLSELIKKNNQCHPLQGSFFTYDEANHCIIQSEQHNSYVGSKPLISIMNRLLYKARRNRKYEAYLQAYIMQNINNEPLKSLLMIDDKSSLWIGNEVSCGVGMQSIDVMTMQKAESTIKISIIELKCVEAYDSIIYWQLPRYITWVSEYLAPLYGDHKVEIVPVILAKAFENDEYRKNYVSKCSAFKYENRANCQISSIKFITYSLTNDGIRFTCES